MKDCTDGVATQGRAGTSGVVCHGLIAPELLDGSADGADDDVHVALDLFVAIRCPGMDDESYNERAVHESLVADAIAEPLVAECLVGHIAFAMAVVVQVDFQSEPVAIAVNTGGEWQSTADLTSAHGELSFQLGGRKRL